MRYPIPTLATLLLLGASLAAIGCSSDSSAAKGSGGNVDTAATGNGATPGTGATAAAAGAGAGTAGSGATSAQGGQGTGRSGQAGQGALGGTGRMRHGVNYGYRNPSFTTDDLGWMAAEAGCDSARLTLPERYLVKWGYDIEKGKIAAEQSHGMTDPVVFLIGPSADHSTAPVGTPDWQLDQYIPKNLHSPIFLADGSVNPENYWAAYVDQTVRTYSYVNHVWEVWNEPDWTADWNTTLTWTTAAPTAQQLVRFHGSIFDYVRMLRITTEVAKKADPAARVALGGVGYASFVSAVLRYTDNPTDGSIDTDHPKKGDAYFDLVSFHYYPLYTKGNSDAATEGFLAQKKSMSDVLAAAQVTGKGFLATETGAPHVVVTDGPSGPEYARNYLLKVMTSAQVAGLESLHWFSLNDGAAVGGGGDAYAYMGLYLDILGLSARTQVTRTDTGTAYRTFGKWLGGALYDATATSALSLPTTLGGAAFQSASGKPAWVLWARGTDETAQGSYSLTTSTAVTTHTWDDQSAALQPTGGKVTLALSSAPLLVTQE